jgi:hypothetical protein
LGSVTTTRRLPCRSAYESADKLILTKFASAFLESSNCAAPFVRGG